MATKEYGIRDLRNDTSGVLAAVEAGDEVFLTKRGRRVAEFRPVAPKDDVERLIDLAERISSGDTGAMADLMQSKLDDLDAQESAADTACR